MKKVISTLLFTLVLVSCFNDADDEFTPQCSEPTNIQFLNTTNESTSISWENSNTVATYSVEYGLSGFVMGTGDIIATTDASITLSGLSANTSYDVYIQAICTDNVSMQTEVMSFTTLPPLVVPQFLTNLSDINLFSGDLADLMPSIYTFEYDLNTPLFTDYSHKQRLIALPPGETMEYIDSGMPNFPDNTVIAKTFFYNNDERDETLGNKIIETRLLIKQSGAWVLGNYKWNDAQTEATLDPTGSTVAFSYVNDAGETQNLNYEIPSAADCVTCHNNNDRITPIGPKLRSMNMNNQLQELIDQSLLSNLTDVSSVTVLPNWEDDRYTLEERARAYFDMNCAHCHSPGGDCSPESNLDFRYETRFDDTNIFEHRFSIPTRTQTLIPNYSMPLIGTTITHPEGYTLIQDYLNTL